MERTQFSLEEVLEMIPNGLFQNRLFAICGLAFMTDSLGVNLLSFLTTCAAAEWKLSNAGQAALTSIVFVGIIAGSIFWGRFADDHGRKKTLLYSCLMVTVGGFASALAPSYEFLVISRGIAGFGIGGASIPFDLLAELLPVATRSKYLVYMGVFWTLGSMLVSGMAWAVLPTLGWRFLSFITTVPVFATTFIAYIYLPESPRWLLEVDREPDAIKIIRDAALVNNVELPEFTLTLMNSVEVHGSYKELVDTPEARRITLPLWLIWAAVGFSYYGTILFVSRVYSNQDNISQDSTPQCEFNYAAIFYNASAEIVSVFISAWLIEPLGRIKSQSVFYLIGGVSVFCMGVTRNPGAVLFFALLARMGINSGLVATWVVTPELFSTETRTMGHSACTAVSRVGSFFASFLVVSDLSYVTIGVVLGLLNLCAAGAAHMLPDTTGKHLDDVNARTLHKSSGHSNNSSADYALVDMMATSSHPLHYNSSHGGGTQEGHSSMSNRGGEIELGPQSTHSRTSLASQHKKGKVDYS